MGLYQSTDASTSDFDRLYLKEHNSCNLVTNDSKSARWYTTTVKDQPEYRRQFQAGTHTLQPFQLHSLIEIKTIHLSFAGGGARVVLRKEAPYTTPDDHLPIVKTFQLAPKETTLDLMDVRSLFVSYRDSYCTLALSLSHDAELVACAESLPLPVSELD